MFPSFSQIKSDARKGLKGIWGRTAFQEFLLFLIGGGTVTFGTCLYEAIMIILFNISARFFRDGTNLEIVGIVTTIVVIHLVISMLQLFLVSGLKMGMKNYYIELANNPNEEPKSGLFSHLKYFSSYFLMTAIRDIYISLLSLLFIVPGVISSMKWSMAPYIVAEDHETRSGDAFVESGYLMEGHKVKFLLFNLSFIGWYILGSISIVGIFFVIPYVEAAKAKYYYYLKHPTYDKDKELNELKSLNAEKFSFDDFMVEYNSKIEQKNNKK